MTGARIGIDVGGTFTDLVALTGDKVITAKVPSRPRDQTRGVTRCLEAAGLPSKDVAVLAHGSTVATNALLERTGGRTALITTGGFRDVIEIGRQNRQSLYDLTATRPPSLVSRGLRFTVDERCGPEGEIAGLDESEIDRVVADIKESGAESVAVCLLFSFLHADHEQAIGRALRTALPDLHVSLSHEVLPEFREYERFSTTVANAYLSVRWRSYLRDLGAVAGRAGMPEPLVMQSSGGVVDMGTAREHAAACILSGPAAGVVGAAHCARASGYEDVLSFDMGGTSTDVAPIVRGEVQVTTDTVLEGVPIKFPTVDVHSVGAGGGSIGWVDDGGALRVGPRSAGADPGPAAYGRGGSLPTVTDANLFLGYLANGACLGTEVTLDIAPAEKALTALGETVGMGAEDAARGIVEVVNAEMAKALRIVSVERGIDPRLFALIAFGGAGPMHACALAEDLGMKVVLVPKESGVLSALGLAMSDLRRDYVTAHPADLATMDGEEVEQKFACMEQRANRDLASPRIARRADLRYKGQSFELTIEADEPATLSDRFHAMHESRFGYRMDAEPVEVVCLRVVAIVDSERLDLRHDAATADPRRTERDAWFDGERVAASVLGRGQMGPGSSVEGPCLIEFKDATCIVRPGWSGVVDGTGTLVLERT